MPVSSEATALLSHLYKTDGSATFSQNGYTIIGAVNGPIEVQRRDELPEEAAIDVIVRPAAGVGSTREKHLESIIEKTLRQIVLINQFPRTLIQVTLQVTSSPSNETTTAKSNSNASNLAILPALLQTSVLALLSAAIPLAAVVTATLLASSQDGTIVENPSVRALEAAKSVHILAFTSQGELVVNLSEGNFSVNEWDSVYEHAESICCGSSDPDDMVEEENGGMMQFVKSVMEDKVQKDLAWKS